MQNSNTNRQPTSEPPQYDKAKVNASGLEPDTIMKNQWAQRGLREVGGESPMHYAATSCFGRVKPPGGEIRQALVA